MQSLFEKWKSRVPKFSELYKDLFLEIANYGGGSEKTRYNLGRHFSSAYEFYMYAFFLGLYNNHHKPIDKGAKKADFGHPIQFWGSKSNRPGREDFTNIQEYMFAALIANTDLDLIELEKGNTTENDAVKSLIETMESYTNGGLMLISEKLEESPTFFLQAPAFLKLLVESQVENQNT